MFTELAPGIFSVATRFVEGTNGIIIGTRGALAVDVGYYSDEGSATADFIRSHGGRPDRVILTHGHSDHVLGGAAFAGAEVYAHARTPEEMRRTLKVSAERQGFAYERLCEQALFPTVTFTDELAIDLGDKRLRLFPTPGHSQDHIAVYVEPDRVLFAGDTVVTAIIPAIGDGDSRALESSLTNLLQLDIEILVAGHGAPLHGSAAVRDWIQWEIDYLSGIRAALETAFAAGKTLNRDQFPHMLPFETWVGNRLAPERNHMERRHFDTISKIASEILTAHEAASCCD